MKQIVITGRISVGRRLILLPMLTIPVTISSRLQVIWNNNNRNYDSASAANFVLALCTEDEFENLFVFFYYCLLHCVPAWILT